MRIKANIILILIITLLAVSSCRKSDDAEISTLSTPLSTVLESTPASSVSPQPFNPLYAFYDDYTDFASEKINELSASFELSSTQDLFKLNAHLYAVTLPMNTVGLFISSTSEDYYGDLSGGFAGSGSMLTYKDRYEFSYDFENSERLWGTFQDNTVTFYKSISGSEDYLKMTLSKTDDGYTSSCRTDSGTTVLTVSADSIVFE